MLQCEEMIWLVGDFSTVRRSLLRTDTVWWVTEGASCAPRCFLPGEGRRLTQVRMFEVELVIAGQLIASGKTRLRFV